MKPFLKALGYVLAPPAALFLVVGGYVAVGHRLVDRGTPAEEVAWRAGDSLVSLHVDERREGEVQTLEVSARADDGTVVHRRSFEIDWDLWGAGYVRGLQVDADPDIELVMVRNGNTANNVYLDPVANGVRERPFDDASDEARATVARWFELRTDSMMLAGLAGLAALLWIAGSSCYYSVKLIRYAWRRRHA